MTGQPQPALAVKVPPHIPSPKVTDTGSEFRPWIDGNGFRRRRLAVLLGHIERNFAGKRVIRVLDVGGTRAFWMGMRDLWQRLPLEITLLNLKASETNDPPFLIRAGNACDLSQFPDASFDLVHSNSVIEHVGTWKEMAAMAGEIRRLARNYFVQTPNFWFPLEPHYRTLFFHWHPEVTRAHMLMRKRRGFRARHVDLSGAMENIQSVRLLTVEQMQALFPDGQLMREKLFGLTKSLVMIR